MLELVGRTIQAASLAKDERHTLYLATDADTYAYTVVGDEEDVQFVGVDGMADLLGKQITAVEPVDNGFRLIADQGIEGERGEATITFTPGKTWLNYVKGPVPEGVAVMGISKDYTAPKSSSRKASSAKASAETTGTEAAEPTAQ